MTQPIEETKNFLGIPIKGEISGGDRRTPQRTQEELTPIIQAVLDDPYFTEFGWRQYTPYFNDGEPCTFGVHGFWIRTQDQEPRDPAGTDEPDQDEDWDEDVEDNLCLDGYKPHPSLGGKNWRNHYQYEGTREAQYNVAEKLNQAIEGGEFENVLLELFGDHAEIKVRRDGIIVDFYSHD